ncbi:MAG: xanthine dehydrogenase family protein molybdopterin-binding subunit [Thalassobaculales bacterium]
MALDDMTGWAVEKFGVGQPVPRDEDNRLLEGKGQYTDDLSLPGQAYAVVVRSPHAHGVIRAVDTEAAAAMPGVLAVLTAADLGEYGTLQCMPPFKNRDGSPMIKPPRPSLAVDRVRFVGDPVAVVVAESLAEAKDAAEAVVLDIDPLPAVASAAEAAAPGAPLLYDEAPGNVALDYLYGDPQKVAAAFAAAAHVTRLPLDNSRVVVAPMEPRSALAEYDAAEGRYVLHVGCQGTFGLRNSLANDLLKVPVEKVRVLTRQVGGSFGMKAPPYPEYVPLLHAARMLGRPVKWTDERSGSFLSDTHGRDHQVTAELALDREGRFLAVRVTGYGNMGAYLGHVSPLMATLNIVKNVIGVYRTPLVEVATKCVFTNTTPVSAYRGAGRPEANYFMERLIDTAAREMGLDRVALRRLNHIRPEEIPYAAPSGLTYDSGDFPAILDKALQLADWDGFAARKAAARARGRLRGIGISDFLEVTAPPSKEMGGVRFEADGTVTMVTGTLDYGQGHQTSLAQVLCQTLQIPFDRIRILQGDSDQLIAGGGTGGSRSMMASGNAIREAGLKVIEIGRQAAAHVLEAAEEDIAFAAGRFEIAGTDRGIGVIELAERLRQGGLPEGVPASLDVALTYEYGASTFPNGCHIVEVEIDPETGVTELVKYSAVNDFGTIINPLLAEGQLHGGIAQGIGQALLEHTVYDADGQLLTGSFMDYALPRADNIPDFRMAFHSVPATTNALGVKGCGEAGCAGSFPAVMNAVVDALSEYGIRHIDMPATPHRVWAAIQAARA